MTYTSKEGVFLRCPMLFTNVKLPSRTLIFIILVIGGFFLFNLIRLIFLNIQNQQTITARKDEVASLEQSVDSLKKQAAYYSTDAYLEKEARDRLQMVKPNETVIVIPESLKQQVKNAQEQDTASKKEPKSPPQQWMALFFDTNESKHFAFDF
jgi:cell division protein FtsB